MSHTPFLHRCLELAARGRKRVGNGAMVGAVLVRGDRILAEGYHEAFGKAHAERQLLQKFDQKISSKDTLYVNLEPCVAGPGKKSPPCADLLIERGVKRVVIGMVDPDSRVAGQGIVLLRSKGVTVEGPFERTRCEWLNRGYVTVRTKNRPWVSLKSARMPDGRVAHEDGSPMVITSPEQNAWSHTFLRDRNDAVLVGVHTIVCDNPTLTVRERIPGVISGFGESKEKNTEIVQPIRIILDPHCRIPEQANVANDAEAHRTVLVVAKDRTRDTARETRLVARGIRLVEVAMEGDMFDWDGLWTRLLAPQADHYPGLTSVLVEGGPRTWDRFRSAGMIDEEASLLGEN